MKAQRFTTDPELRELVMNKVEAIIAKPRVSAYTPQALVEVVYALLSLVYDERKFEKYMHREYGGSRPWWLNDDVDYPIAVTRLQKLVLLLKDDALD